MSMFGDIARESMAKAINNDLDIEIEKAREKVNRLGYQEDRAYLNGLLKAKEIVNSNT